MQYIFLKKLSIKIIRHSKCGKLQCQGGNDKPLVGTTRLAYRNTLTVRGGNIECKTIASVISADISDLNLVRTGTMCGVGKVSLSYILFQNLRNFTCFYVAF